MDSSTTRERTSEAEISARLERATRSGLASSTLASYSYSQASSTSGHLSQPPTLADLLPHLGPPDALRCPACRVSLTFGRRSRICLACTAPLLQSPLPSFTSSLAFRRFSEALHIDGLETNFGEAEEEICSDPEATKSSSSFSLPLEVGGHKVLSHADIPSHQRKSTAQPETVKSDAQTLLPSSGDLGSITPAKPMDLANVDGGKQPSILDYSSKLEGISLDDFFSNEVKSQASALATSSDMISDNFLGRSTSMHASGINVHKDSLFWDPLSESIIPDGFDLMADTSETSTNKVAALDNVVGVEDDDDPFSSWEGDFQSAALATADVSPASSSHTPGPQLSAQPITSRNIEDLFGDFSNTSSVGESGGIQGTNSWVNDGDLFGLDTDVENTFKTDFQRGMDVGNFFGSGWQQSVPRPVVSTTSYSQSFNKQSVLLESSQEEDLLGIKQRETPIGNNSLGSVGEFTSTEDFLMERPASASASVGKRNKIVGSLLAQLHDLSFLLADKLVIRTEGKNTQPDSSS